MTDDELTELARQIVTDELADSWQGYRIMEHDMFAACLKMGLKVRDRLVEEGGKGK